MFKISLNNLAQSKKGQMPFAIIAVTLLVMGSAYGIVSASTERAAENIDNIGVEIEAVGDAKEDVCAYVNRGMGEIIYNISTDPNGGTMKDRSEKFDVRAEKWMSRNFPISVGCVVADLKDYNFKLDVKSLKLDAAENTDGISTPAYLVAKGSFTADFSSDSAHSEFTVDIESDGTYALPLISEKASLFEQNLTSGVSILFQMMNYQISSLAQTRVLNGYGSLSEYGEMGTKSIITDEDATLAYNNALRAVQMICFRTTDGDYIPYEENMDLADLYIADGNKIEIDLSAVYAQTILSILDDMVLQWIDYLRIDDMFAVLGTLGDTVVGIRNFIKGALDGNNYEDASGYLAQAMKDHGYPESQYRYLFNGKHTYLSIPYAEYNINGESFRTGFNGSIEYPDVDLHKWSGMTGFVAEYRDTTNELSQKIQSFLNSTALDLSKRKPLGSIVIDINAYDKTDYLTSLNNAINEFVDGSRERVNREIMSSAANQKVYDPFYGSIFEKISKNRDSAYGISDLKSNIKANIRNSVMNQVDATSRDIDKITEEMMRSSSVRSLINDYERAVDSKVEKISSITQTTKDRDDGNLKRLFTAMLEADLSRNAEELMTKHMGGLMQEVANSMSLYECGVMEFPGKEGYSLSFDNGSKVTEKLEYKQSNDLKVDVYTPDYNYDRCIHYVGFKQSSGASYSSMFTISIKDTITYNVSSNNGIIDALGLDKSSVSRTIPIDLQMEISVISGWALAGVEYEASNTLLGDAWEALMEFLEPILGPLRVIYAMLVDLGNAICSVLIEIAKFAAQIVETIFNVIMDVIDWLKRTIEKWIVDGLVALFEDQLKPLVDITSKEQGVGFELFGMTVMISTKAQTWVKSTKTIGKVSLVGNVCGLELNSSLSLFKDSRGQYTILGDAFIKGNGFELNVSFDPCMKNTRHLVSVDGKIGDTDMYLTFPELIQYREIGISLADIPGVGTALSNIPLPIPGLKAGIDVGLNLKYSAPFEIGVLINEFESNPSGDDAGFEWVELYNSTGSRVDLTGYTLHAGSNEKEKYVVLDGSISPRGRMVVTLDSKMVLINGSSNGKSGECIILRDTAGQLVDKTPWCRDEKNDDFTWQRIADGSTEWALEPGSPNSSNGSGKIGVKFVEEMIVDIFKDSAIETFDSMGSELKGLDDLSEFFEKMMRNAIDTAIERIAGCVVEASMFLTVTVQDYSGSLGVGMKISLAIGSDFIEDGLKWLVGEIEALVFNVKNPFGMRSIDVITDNVYVKLQIFTGMSMPKILDPRGNTEVNIGISIACNVSGLGALIGYEGGRWRVEAGIVIENCPYAAIPSGLDADKNQKSDLWLMKAVFERGGE